MSILDIFASSGPKQVVLPQYTGVQLQTSSNALPIPIVYGTNIVAPNIIFAGVFLAEPVYSGKTITGYNYTQNLIFALCEGPVSRLGLCYQDSDVFTPGDLGEGVLLANGAVPPSLPTGPAFVGITKQLAYAGTAYAYASQFNLGTDASTGTINFEMHGILDASSGLNGYDADPALIFQDFWTSATYGLAMPAVTLDLAALLSPAAGPDASYQGYCKAAGLALSPALIDAETASSILTRWLQLTNSTAVWSGGQLKVLPYGDTPIAKVATQTTLSQPIPALDGDTTDGTNSPYIRVNNGFVSDQGVINSATGKAFTKVPTYTTDPTYGNTSLNSGQYYLSPVKPGLYVFSQDDINVPITISYTYVPLAAFTPNLAPVYELDDDDFVAADDEDPVQVARTDPAEVANVLRIEIFDRTNYYSATSIEVRDQNAVETYGYRLGSTVTAHEITNGQSGQLAAQLILQRGLGIRNTYKFKLSWEYGLLEAMDIVAITDANLGLTAMPVRLIAIEEDDQGLLSMTAEEFPPGIGSAVPYGTGGAVPGGAASTTTTPSPVTPVIYEAPEQYADNQILVVFGATSTSGGAPDPNYGGCAIWVSYDGNTYSQLVSLMGQSATGTTTADCPTYVGPNPDTVDTLSVNMAASGASLAAGSEAQAQNLETLILVGSEMMAYGSAAPGSAAGTYALTYLERGAYGSSIADQPAGSSFLSLQGQIASATLPRSSKGTTVYFKFQPSNIFGKGAPPLASCTAYPLAVTGVGLSSSS